MPRKLIGDVQEFQSTILSEGFSNETLKGVNRKNSTMEGQV